MQIEGRLRQLREERERQPEAVPVRLHVFASPACPQQLVTGPACVYCRRSRNPVCQTSHLNFMPPTTRSPTMVGTLAVVSHGFCNFCGDVPELCSNVVGLVTPMLSGTSPEVLVKHAQSNIEIRRQDMAKLATLAWLNDEIINVYMAMLLERDVRLRKLVSTPVRTRPCCRSPLVIRLLPGLQDAPAGPKCHFFNTFFAKKLYGEGAYDYNSVRRWTMPSRLSKAGQPFSCILDCDRIIIPVHQGIHWVCAVIDLQQRKFVLYDSMLVSEGDKPSARSLVPCLVWGRWHPAACHAGLRSVFALWCRARTTNAWKAWPNTSETSTKTSVMRR